MRNLKEYIEENVREIVLNSSNATKYRTPLVAFADANDKRFNFLKEHAHPEHFTPFDLLLDAKTVVAFFIPFTRELVELNKNHSYVSREWAVAYIETNKLIGEICSNMKKKLNEQGISCETVPATHNFDEEKLMSRWSHRHAAYIAGLGTFGLNNMLITKSGCAGRYGSFIINKYIEPTEGLKDEYCLYKKNGSCGICVKMCPSGALNYEGFDRHKCYKYLLEVADRYKDVGFCDACGKCDNGPCAVLE